MRGDGLCRQTVENRRNAAKGDTIDRLSLWLHHIRCRVNIGYTRFGIFTNTRTCDMSRRNVMVCRILVTFNRAGGDGFEAVERRTWYTSGTTLGE